MNQDILNMTGHERQIAVISAAVSAGQFDLAREQVAILSAGNPAIAPTMLPLIEEAESIAYQAGEGVIARYVNQNCPF